MIELPFEEINISDCETQKPTSLTPTTLKQVQKQMKGFDESLVLYMYHHLNGREGEARTYLAEWEEEQEELKHSFRLMNDLQKLNENANQLKENAT